MRAVKPGLAFLIAALATFVGCSSTEGQTGRATAAEQQPPEQGYTCTDDSQCRMSCVGETDCCGNPCGCDTVRHVDDHERVQKLQIEHCSDKIEECPDVGACAPDYDYAVPKCVEGKCVGELPASRR